MSGTGKIHKIFPPYWISAFGGLKKVARAKRKNERENFWGFALRGRGVAAGELGVRYLRQDFL